MATNDLGGFVFVKWEETGVFLKLNFEIKSIKSIFYN